MFFRRATTMADFRLGEDSSDSDDEDLMAELMQAMFEREADGRPPQDGDDDDARRAMLFEMALEAGEGPEMAARFAFMDDGDVAGIMARQRDVEVGGAGGGAPGAVGGAGGPAGAGAGAGGPRGGMLAERRAVLRLLMRRRFRHPPHARRGVAAEMARFRRLQMEMHNECQRERQRENQNLNEHSCQYCPIKKRKLDAIPQLNFRPTTLRQQILLQLGYTTYGKTGDQSADNLPLPEALIAEVKRVHDELQRWRQDNKRFDETARDSIIYRCFLSDLHWIPGKTVIDRRTTARMILQCDVGFYRPNEFLLAAANCLEDEVARLWPLLDQRTREHWNSADNPYVKNPIFMYWIAKCANRPERMTCALDRMASYCIDKGEQNFDTLTYFWPSIVESKGGIGSDDMAILLDHSFHEAIEQSNREAAYFIWRQAPVENYRSMVSAAHCCGARNAYYAFGKAVEAGQYDVVQFMWNKTDAEQHNGMLLAEHAKSFCLAAEQGFVDIARLLWRDTTYNQRFVLLFEQSCAAFRRSCANGHVEIVRLLWEDASVEQRRQILTMCQYEALAQACKNGHLNVVRYLWENQGDQLKSYLVDSRWDFAILSKCIAESAYPDGTDVFPERISDTEAILRYLFLESGSDQENSRLAPTKSQVFQALLLNDQVALTALMERGEKGKKWDEITHLFRIFDREQREVLRAKISDVHANACGLSSGAASGFRPVTSGMSTACIPKSSASID